MPTNAKGVTVKLSVYHPNENTYDIGTATADIKGNYALSWTPPVPGVYAVTATVERLKLGLHPHQETRA